MELLYHSILPGLSIIIASIGVWTITMRGMLTSVQGEDYGTFAEIRGLKSHRIFFRYGMRNAVLPQVTALALHLGEVVTVAILVEIVSDTLVWERLCSNRYHFLIIRRSMEL
jgi:peptide/nickel transport system permease protein